jgi:hypothetical protein
MGRRIPNATAVGDEGRKPDMIISRKGARNQSHKKNTGIDSRKANPMRPTFAMIAPL